MWHYSNLYHVYNNNYNKNYSFVRYSYLLTTFLQATIVLYTAQNFSQDWLNYNWLLPAFNLQNVLKVEGSKSREFYRDSLCIVYMEVVRCIC